MPSRRPADLGGEQVEGHHAVHELLLSGRRQVRRLWVADDQIGTGPLVAVVDLARRMGTPLQLKRPDALAAAARTGAPQGVIAWAEPVRAVPLDGLVRPAASGVPPFLLVLDGVTDPGNFGAVLRSAACAGVGGVIVGRHRSAPLTPAAVKAAAGAVEQVAIAEVPGIASTIAQLTSAGIWTVGLDPSAGDDLWRSGLLDGPVALVLGSEGKGLSSLVRQRCDALVCIPQAGSLGSLNISAAAAVACFEVARRRASAPPPPPTLKG